MERQPEKLDPLSPHGRKILNEIKERKAQAAHVFLSPEVIEIHLQHGIPIQPGTARLIWALSQLFKEEVEHPPGEEPPLMA